MGKKKAGSKSKISQRKIEEKKEEEKKEEIRETHAKIEIQEMREKQEKQKKQAAVEFEERKNAGRPHKTVYAWKEAVAYVTRYLNKKLNLGKNVTPSRGEILKYAVDHGIISSGESDKNLALLITRDICRIIFARAVQGLPGDDTTQFLKTSLNANLALVEKDGPRVFSMKETFALLKIKYTEEDEEDEEDEEYEEDEEAEEKKEQNPITRKTIKQLTNEFDLSDTEYETSQIKGDIDDSLKYLEHFRNIYINFQEIPNNIKRKIMSSKTESMRLGQYKQLKAVLEKYFSEKKQIFPIPKIEERDKLIDRASMFYGASAMQSQPSEIKGDELPLFKLSLPVINIADAKSNEVRAELEAEKKEAEDINKQIDMFTIQNIGSNRIQSYNNALISAGMTSEEERKRAIKRVFFTAIKAKLKDEVGALVKMYKLENTTIDKDIKNMLEKQTQPSMIEEFDPLSFLTQAKQYISVVTESTSVALGVEEGKLLDTEEKELINKPIENLQTELKEENNIIQLNKRIIKGKIKEAIKLYGGSLEPVLNPSIRRMNNLPDNVIPVISKPDIHGDERRVLCNYGTSYN